MAWGCPADRSSASPSRARCSSGPSVLIFDEATSNLDVETSEHFARTINQLKGSTTILFITHQVPRGLAVDAIVRLGDQGRPLAEPGTASPSRQLAPAARVSAGGDIQPPAAS